MKGVILAGGTGSRLYPLTKITNKHLLPIGQYPMIYHSIHKLMETDVKDILVVTGKEHMGNVINLLGSGLEFGVSFTYKVQEQAGGIAQALGLAEGFVGNDSMVVMLGDNVFSHPISDHVLAFQNQGSGARILIHEVQDPKRYGVPQLMDGRIVHIEEKPDNPKSTYAVTGIYMYHNNVFDIIRTLRPSARGELEVTDVNNKYIQTNELHYSILDGWWTDAGTMTSYAKANEFARDIQFQNGFDGKK